MEASDISGAECWELHRLRNSIDEICAGLINGAFAREAVDMYHWQIKLASLPIQPDLFISISKSSNEAVKEFNCIHWQVHHAVLELSHFCWHSPFISLLIIFVHEHAQVGPRIHVKGDNPAAELVQLDVLIEELICNWVEIIC